jgi:hypothetical protein
MAYLDTINCIIGGRLVKKFIKNSFSEYTRSYLHNTNYILKNNFFRGAAV